MSRRASLSFMTAAASIAVAVAGGPGAAGEPQANKSIGVLSDEELSDVRGREGDVSILVESRNDVTASFGQGTLNAGSVKGGAVTIGGQAMQAFSGINTQTFVTGNFNNATASTAVTIMLLP